MMQKYLEVKAIDVISKHVIQSFYSLAVDWLFMYLIISFVNRMSSDTFWTAHSAVPHETEQFSFTVSNRDAIHYIYFYGIYFLIFFFITVSGLYSCALCQLMVFYEVGSEQL